LRSLDAVELLALGSIWGCSFLFMRLASPEFGPVPLIALRVTTAALFLLPILVWTGNPRAPWQRRGEMLVIGFFNSAFPFCLFAFATLSLTGGFTAVLNATAPLFTAVVAYLWVGERLSRLGAFGLLVGLFGVVVLVWDKLGVDPGSAPLAIAAGLLGACSYGIAANHARVRFSGIGSLEMAGGSQVAASILLLPLCWFWWPETVPSTQAWLAMLALGIPCTGIAYILYFRLLSRLGPSRAVTVTYIVPLAAMVFGALLMDESVTLRMLAGCGLILLGTGLATGVLRPALAK
jgi:drug/metabolite transporter (DMT)-like permease